MIIHPVRFLTFLGGLIVLAGCQTFTRERQPEKDMIKLRPTFISDTLSKKNEGYRKVNLFTPLIYEDSVIVSNALDGISKFNLKSNDLEWKIKLNYGVEAPGLLAGKVLFVGGLDGVMYSIDVESGAVIWKFDTKSEITAQPTLQSGALYFLNGSGLLFSLDAASGRQQWVYNRQETAVKMTVRGASRPTVHNGTVYVGFSDGSLVALALATGTPQWEVLLNRNSRFKDIDATPIISGDQIFISSYDDKMYCLSVANGSVLWQYPAGGATAPTVTGDRLIYSSSAGELISLNRKTGELIWKKSDVKGIPTEPVLVKGYVLFGESQGPLRALDILTGEQKASFDPGRGIMSRPSSFGDKIYFISGEANFYQLEISPITSRMIPYLVN